MSRLPPEISAKDAHELWKAGSVKLLDVRGDDERTLAKIAGVPTIDQAMADDIIAKWPKDTPMVIHCHHGMRSLSAAAFFIEKGFTNVKSMRGGIDAWSAEVDPKIRRY